MTRDAEHTPSPESVVVPVEPTEAMHYAGDRILANAVTKGGSIYDTTKAMWSALLAAAPAPSSLAGGEVTNDDAPTYMRLAQALSRHPEVMVVERSDPTLELTPDSLEHLLDDVFPLAALSPEAPAREVTDAMVEAACSRFVSESEDIWSASVWPEGLDDDGDRGDGGRVRLISEDDQHKIRAAMRFALQDALTPRHEAPNRNPLDPDAPSEAMIDAGLKVDWSNEDERGTVINVWYAMNAARRHEAPASHAFEASHSVQREGGCKVCGHDEASHEAPAEGAGEAMTEREVRQWIDACNHEPARQVLRDYLALRARSSAPEAREEALGNLLAVIHGDGGHRALEVGTKQAALEAEKIVADLLSSAPEAREGEAVTVSAVCGWCDGAKVVQSQTYGHVICSHCRGSGVETYTRNVTAAPSADKLRIAVEALEPFAKAADKLDGLWSEDDWRWNDSVRSGVTVRDIRRASQALATLKAEGA